jgi:hypothetical protein
MSWVVGIALTVVAWLAFSRWLDRPFPPAPLAEVDLNDEFYGLCAYGLRGSRLRLTHCKSGLAFEFRKDGDEHPTVTLAETPPDPSGECMQSLMSALTATGVATRPVDATAEFDLGPCTARGSEDWARIARLAVGGWSLNPSDKFQCVFYGKKDKGLMYERLKEGLRESRSK